MTPITYRGYQIHMTQTNPDRIDWYITNPEGRKVEDDDCFAVTVEQVTMEAKDVIDDIIEEGMILSDDLDDPADYDDDGEDPDEGWVEEDIDE